MSNRVKNSLGRKPYLLAFGVLLTTGLLSPVEAQTFYWNPNTPTFGTPGEIQKSYHWTSNQDGTGSRPLSTLDDDFSGSTLGSGWTYLDSIHDGFSNYSLTTKSGKLYLAGRGADVWTGSNAYSAIYRNTAY